MLKPTAKLLFLFLVAAAICFAGWPTTTEAQIVVDQDLESVQEIATALCNGQSKDGRISRPSTISKLYQHFKSISKSQQVDSCQELYLEPLEDLTKIVETNDDVCSHQSFARISKFHWDYVAASLRNRKWHTRSYDIVALPEPLRLFFMHYVNELTERCMEAMAGRLQVAAAADSQEVQAESLFQNNFGRIIEQLSVALVPQAKVKNFDTFFFLWSQILAKERKKGNLLAEDIDDVSGESVVALLKIPDARQAWTIQHQCRHQLRPVYRDTVLPVMRLIELGYGQLAQSSSQQQVSFERNKLLVSNWYSITQLCELLIPVNFYMDEAMKPTEAVIMESFEEAEGLLRAPDTVHVDQIPAATSNLPPVHLAEDKLAADASDNRIVKQVKTNLKKRSRLFRQFYKSILSSMKNKLGSKLRNFFVSRKSQVSGNQYLRESGEDIVRKSDADVTEITKDDDDEGRLLIRRKRSEGNNCEERDIERKPEEEEEEEEEKKKLEEEKKPGEKKKVEGPWHRGWRKVKRVIKVILTIIGWVCLILFILFCLVVLAMSGK